MHFTFINTPVKLVATLSYLVKYKSDLNFIFLVYNFNFTLFRTIMFRVCLRGLNVKFSPTFHILPIIILQKFYTSKIIYSCRASEHVSSTAKYSPFHMDQAQFKIYFYTTNRFRSYNAWTYTPLTMSMLPDLIIKYLFQIRPCD